MADTGETARGEVSPKSNREERKGFWTVTGFLLDFYKKIISFLILQTKSLKILNIPLYIK